MSLRQWIKLLPATVLAVTLVMGLPVLGQQTSDEGDAVVQETDDSTSQDKLSDDRDKTSSESGSNQQEDPANSQNNEQAQSSQAQNRQTQDTPAGQTDSGQNNNDLQQSQQSNLQRDRRESQERFRRQEDSQPREQERFYRAQERQEGREDNRYDRREDRFDRREDRFDRREDRFSQQRDRFDDQSQDDRFDRRGSGQRERLQDRRDSGVDLGASLRLNENDQMVVTQLSNRGFLAGSDLREGDVLLSINGRAVSSQSDLQRWLLRADSGQRIPVVVMRNGQRETIYVEGRSSYDNWDTNLGLTFRADPQGRLIISDLARSGLLVDAGLRRGDILVAVDGRPVTSQREFVRIVTDYDGRRIPVVVLRDGRRETIYVSVTESLQGRDSREYYADDYRRFRPESDRAWLGVYLDTRYSDDAVVEAVQIGSTADRAGLREGDRIIAVNGVRIESPTHLSRMVRSMEPGEEIRLEVSRRVTREVSARLGERPESGGRFRYDDELTENRSETFRSDTYRTNPGESDTYYEERGFRGDVQVETDNVEGFDRDRGILDGRIRERIRERRNR